MPETGAGNGRRQNWVLSPSHRPVASFAGGKEGLDPHGRGLPSCLPGSHPPAGELEGAAALQARAARSPCQFPPAGHRRPGPPRSGLLAGSLEGSRGAQGCGLGEPQRETQGRPPGPAELSSRSEDPSPGEPGAGNGVGRLLCGGDSLRVADCIQTLTRTLGCQSRRGLGGRPPHFVSTKATEGAPRRSQPAPCSLSLVSRGAVLQLSGHRNPLKE